MGGVYERNLAHDLLKTSFQHDVTNSKIVKTLSGDYCSVFDLSCRKCEGSDNFCIDHFTGDIIVTQSNDVCVTTWIASEKVTNDCNKDCLFKCFDKPGRGVAKTVSIDPSFLDFEFKRKSNLSLRRHDHTKVNLFWVIEVREIDNDFEIDYFTMSNLNKNEVLFYAKKSLNKILTELMEDTPTILFIDFKEQLIRKKLLSKVVIFNESVSSIQSEISQISVVGINGFLKSLSVLNGYRRVIFSGAVNGCMAKIIDDRKNMMPIANYMAIQIMLSVLIPCDSSYDKILNVICKQGAITSSCVTMFPTIMTRPMTPDRLAHFKKTSLTVPIEAPSSARVEFSPHYYYTEAGSPRYLYTYIDCTT